VADEVSLSGGNITSITRVGTTVRREPGPWTSATHDLLRYLERAGFSGVPRVLGFDERGREILTFIEGVAGFFAPGETRPANLWSDQVLIEAAAFLRRFHDATLGFQAPPAARWQMVFPDAGQHEVICHNDFAPYNCIFADGHLKAVIDFDTAGPGPRRWDLAYAAYRFVPLAASDKLPSIGAPAELNRGRRLKLFCDAYGLEQRHGLLDVIQERIDATRMMLIDGAASGNVGYQRILDEGGHIEGLRRDQAFVEEQADELQTWVDS
jgi:hypothetical protein